MFLGKLNIPQGTPTVSVDALVTWALEMSCFQKRKEMKFFPALIWYMGSI